MKHWEQHVDYDTEEFRDNDSVCDSDSDANEMDVLYDACADLQDLCNVSIVPVGALRRCARLPLARFARAVSCWVSLGGLKELPDGLIELKMPLEHA